MEPFVGQLMLASFSYAPRYWAQCNGQTMQISANQALFSLLQTYYGGDGMRTFALPNLQGKTPIGFNSSNYPLGNIGGEAAHQLNASEMPGHNHQLYAATTGANDAAATGGLVAGAGATIFAAVPASNPPTMTAATLPSYGGGLGHENRQPFVVMNWCISLNGIYPSRS